MTVSPHVEQMIALYWEGDRSDVRKRYEEIFGESGIQAEKKPKFTGKTEDDFDILVEFFNLSDSLKDGLRERWNGVVEQDREIALHYLFLIINDRWTPYHVLEGMMNYFWPKIATHVVHACYRHMAFPLDADLRYDQLSRIVRMLGIKYADDEGLLPIDVASNLIVAIEDYRSDRNLDYWEMWALLYDLGPRLLPAPAPVDQDFTPKIWIIPASELDFATVDGHTSSSTDVWSINPKARRGDIALMYCLSPRSACVGVYRCGCDAFRNPFNQWWTSHWIEITDKLEIPWLSLQEMKKDKVLSKWNVVKAQFQGMIRHQIRGEIWQRILELVKAKDAQAGVLLEEYGEVGDSRLIRGVDEVISEKDFEEQIVVPLLERLGWKMMQTMQRQFEMNIKIGSGRPHQVRADFVGFQEILGSEALLVVECKRKITSAQELRSAVEQCESYAGKLRCTRFAVAAPEGLWVFDLKFPGQSQEVAHIPFSPDSSIPIHLLTTIRKWMGYGELGGKAIT